MVISKSLKNRLVGFAIVASSILIFLPVILSKDVIVKQNPDAVAIDNNGAVLNQEGKLTYKPSANLEQALNINGQNEALLAQEEQQAAQNNMTITPSDEMIDNGVEMLEFSRPGQPSQSEILVANNKNKPPKNNVNEVLTAPKPSTVVKEPVKAPKEPEILVAQSAPKKEAKPVKAPAPVPAPAANKNKDDVLAGTRPSERFVVQVGVFSKKDNALNVIDKLKKAGISYYAVKITNSSGSVFYRVYGGRSNNKNDLVPLVSKIDKLCITKSKIVPM